MDLTSLLLISLTVAVTFTVGCLCSVVLTAVWIWRGNVLHKCEVIEKKGGQEERESHTNTPLVLANVQ